MFIQVRRSLWNLHMVIWETFLGKKGFTFGSRYSGIKYVVKYASLLPLVITFFFHVNANSHLLLLYVFYNYFLESQLLNYRQQFNKPKKKSCQSD